MAAKSSSHSLNVLSAADGDHDFARVGDGSGEVAVETGRPEILRIQPVAQLVACRGESFIWRWPQATEGVHVVSELNEVGLLGERGVRK